jgi:DNA excision repair protein ERCC-4
MSPFIILADTREQCVPPFPEGVVIERVTMSEADYTTAALQGVAVIERKSISDFASSITHDRERFDDEVRRLLPYRWRCVVVEGEIGEVWRSSAVHAHAVIGSVASFYARFDLPCLFAGTPAGAGRLIAGILRRWEERLASELTFPWETAALEKGTSA